MKLEEYMYRSQLPRMQYIIENFEESARLRKTLSGEHHKVGALASIACNPLRTNHTKELQLLHKLELEDVAY